MSVIARVQMCCRNGTRAPGLAWSRRGHPQEGRAGGGRWAGRPAGLEHGAKRAREAANPERAAQEGPAEENSGCEPGLPALTWATAGTRSLHSLFGAHWFRVTRRIRSERPGLTVQGGHGLSAELERKQEPVAPLPIPEPACKAWAFPTASWRPAAEDGKLPGVGASAFWALKSGRRSMTWGSGRHLAVRP